MIRQEYKWLTDIYVAHRGLFDNANGIPENSLPAFNEAVKYGFGIETDVQMSKDGVLLVFHDDTLDRMTGIKGNLTDYSFDELRRMRLLNTDCKIPTFEEFLQAANGVNLVVEIKTHKHIGKVEQKVYDALKNYSGNYCVESFNPFIIRWFKVHAPEVVRGTLSCDFSPAPWSKFKKKLLSDLKLCKWNGSQFIAYDYKLAGINKAVQKFRKQIPVIGWTVQSQADYNEYCRYFDNMIFDSFLPERNDLKALNNNK